MLLTVPSECKLAAECIQGHNLVHLAASTRLATHALNACHCGGSAVRPVFKGSEVLSRQKLDTGFTGNNATDKQTMPLTKSGLGRVLGISISLPFLPLSSSVTARTYTVTS